MSTADSARARVPTFELVFRRHFGDVYRMAARILGPGASSADVDDVAQKVFVAVSRKLPGFRGESKLETWLYGITSRVVLNEMRSWRRQRRLQAAIEIETTDLFDKGTPEMSAMRRQTLRTVWSCLMKIKPKKRIVFIMHELEGKTGLEIAEALEIPEATVWTRLHHARKELSRALAHHEEELR